MSCTVWVVNGPNLNLLGSRETHLYGTATLDEIERELVAEGARLGCHVECFQSNHEGELVDRVQAAHGSADALIVNFAAYSHTSIALRDALTFVGLPTVEVHLSNVHAREPFRHTLVTAAACTGSIVGLGAMGYRLALHAVHQRLTNAAASAKGEHQP